MKKTSAVETLMKTQLTEREIIIYLIVESGEISMNKLGNILQSYPKEVARTYESAKEKMQRFNEMGLFTSSVEKSKK